MRVAACGRRWGKTEALSLDIATLALDERDCRQLVVAPTDVQARLLGNEVLARLLDGVGVAGRGTGSRIRWWRGGRSRCGSGRRCRW